MQAPFPNIAVHIVKTERVGFTHCQRFDKAARVESLLAILVPVMIPVPFLLAREMPMVTEWFFPTFSRTLPRSGNLDLPPGRTGQNP